MPTTPKRLIPVLVALAVILGACSTSTDTAPGLPAGSAGTSSTSSPAMSQSASATPPTVDVSGGSSTVALGDATVNTCDLLTPEEVAVAIGEPTEDPVFDDSLEGFFTCSYEGAGGNMMVDITVYPDVETAKGVFAVGIDMGGNERIEGPGDEAMSTQPTGDITVRVGRTEIDIDLFSNSMSLEEELLVTKDLAARIVAQLG